MDIKLFDSELKVMDVLWKRGDTPAKEIARTLTIDLGWNVNTTYTLIKRCMKKGAIERSEPGFLCHALIPKSAVQEAETDELINKIYDGSADKLFAALLGLCMAFTGVGIATQHPYQYAYYQPLVQLRGMDYNELDYWNVSARDALVRLAGAYEGVLTVEPADLWSDYALQRALASLPNELAGRFVCLPEGSGARFVLSNPTYACFSGFSPGADTAECVTLSAYGHPIMILYERTAKEADRP